MPKTFCLHCGFAHVPSDMETCDKNVEKARTCAWKRTEKLLAKPPSRDSLLEESICQFLSGMMLEDRKRQVMAEINAIKLENRVAEIEAERDRLLLSRKQREWLTCSSPGRQLDKMVEWMAGTMAAATQLHRNWYGGMHHHMRSQTMTSHDNEKT